MTAMSRYDKKNFKNLFSYELETWHAASETRALQSLFINDVTGMLRKGQIWLPMHLNGGNSYLKFI